MDTDDTATGSILDRNSLDDPAYMRGQILAIVVVLRYILNHSTPGGLEAHSDFFAKAHETLRSLFDKSNKDFLAGGDEIIEMLSKSTE